MYQVTIGGFAGVADQAEAVLRARFIPTANRVYTPYRELVYQVVLPDTPQDLTWTSQKVYDRRAESAGQARMFSEDGIMPRLAAALCTAGSPSACMGKAPNWPVCSAEQRDRLERCILEVKERGGKVNPFAVRTASVGCRRAPMKIEGVAEEMKTKTKAASKKVADLTVGELKAVIKEIVRTELEKMLGDPDEGLELTDECKESLQRSLASKEPRLTLQEVAEEFGVKL